jgi:tetratricopeptide (TPR) repeat protein
MQRAADALVGTLREFINQPDFPTLVLGATDAAVALPNRTLYSFSQEDEDHYFLLFPNPAPNGAAYMDAIAQALVPQRESLNAGLVARGAEPLPPWPLEVEDSRIAPDKRLRAAIEYCGQHLPQPDAIVWGFLPAEIGDMASYKALIAPLLCPGPVEPWMDRHRFIVRDADPNVLIPELYQAKNDRVLVMELDFSNESYERELHRTALDKALPHDDRVFAFFQLACLDFAFKRYPDAIEKYGHCFNYYNSKGNKPLATLCLKGAGDTTLQGGRPLDALKFYQQSIALSMQDKNMMTLQQGLQSAAQTSMDLGKIEDAEGYFKHSSQVAGKLMNPHAKVDAMERQGQCEWQLGKFQEAQETWTNGKNLARQFGYYQRAYSILDRLIAMYRVSGMSRQASDCEQEKLVIANEAAAPAPAGAAYGR